VESVGVDDMDDEHHECVNAINNLILERSLAALQDVLGAVSDHFEHEENLLSEHLYHDCDDMNSAEGGFNAFASMKRSHFQDHKRIIAALEAAVASVSRPGVDVHEKGLVNNEIITDIKKDFEEHASRYDSTYAASLPEAISKVKA